MCANNRWFGWCCYPPQNNDTIESLSAADVGDILRAGQAELYFLLTIQLVVHVVWQLLAFIPGVCPLEGANTFNAVCHTGFWVVIDLLVFAVGVASVGFGVWSGTTGTLIKDVMPTRKWLLAWLILIIVALVANVTHIIATGIELTDCTTTLCTDTSTQGYLVGIIIGLVVLVLVEIFQFYRAYTYRTHVWLANTYHTDMFTMLEGGKAPQPTEARIVVSSMRATPMRHGLKQRGE